MLVMRLASEGLGVSAGMLELRGAIHGCVVLLATAQLLLDLLWLPAPKVVRAARELRPAAQRLVASVIRNILEGTAVRGRVTGREVEVVVAQRGRMAMEQVAENHSGEAAVVVAQTMALRGPTAVQEAAQVEIIGWVAVAGPQAVHQYLMVRMVAAEVVVQAKRMVGMVAWRLYGHKQIILKLQDQEEEEEEAEVIVLHRVPEAVATGMEGAVAQVPVAPQIPLVAMAPKASSSSPITLPN